MRRSALLALVLWAVLAAAAAVIVLAQDEGPSPAPSAGRNEGLVRVVERLDSRFDRYTSAATSSVRSWINTRLWRATVYSPYFDDKTAWYERGWAYRDLYGLEVGSSLVRHHPDWILRDARGRRLYLQYACTGRACSQYAADPTDAGFQAHWIAAARQALARGYKGLFIDDVNLELRVSDGAGRTVRPLHAGRPMSDAAWREAIASFTAKIRRALPDAEIVHNSIWFAGGPRRQADPSVRRQIRSADIINLERGVNDEGLNGDGGQWSVQALLRYVDDVHRLGRAVIFEGIDPSVAGREYNLAAELLISGGADAIGVTELEPHDPWARATIDLGAAAGPREADGSVLRRRFASGLALLNVPGAERTTVALDGEYLTLEGRRVTQVTLGPGRGAVLRRP